MAAAADDDDHPAVLLAAIASRDRLLFVSSRPRPRLWLHLDGSTAPRSTIHPSSSNISRPALALPPSPSGFISFVNQNIEVCQISPLLADGIAASYAEPTGLFFNELDALAAEFGPAVPSPPRVSPVPPSASGAGTSLPRTACTPPTGGEWLRPESPLPQQAPTLVVDVPDGVLYDVPMVVLDLDGRPLAHSLPSSVADNAALRAFLTSCSRPLPPALLSPPLPLPPLAAKAVGVVPKRSERIAAKMALEALEGPIHAVSRAQRNLMRKLGLVPERGPVTAEAVAAYNALFSKPLSQEHIIALSSLFSSSLPPAKAAEELVVCG
ncbi:hypothetical protein DAI22_12g185801 [Oryza sativa Japonica Group]|nr:hypothetical protein DAI22_12g185801 [Oryza sativa Japonica Group]